MLNTATLVAKIWLGSWDMFLAAAGFILLGLLIAGLVHTLLPGSLVVRYLGRRGLSGAARAALIGVPLPICSCGVVPLAMELRRKGASRPATLSFLITTPESGVDSILLTWGLMGPVMAVVRPVAAFLTAMLAAVLSIADTKDEDTNDPWRDQVEGEPAGSDQDICGCPDGTCATAEGEVGSDRAEQNLVGLRRWFRQLIPGRLGGKKVGDDERETEPFSLRRNVAVPAVRYACTELLDDIVFWLLLGVVAAGVISAVVPDNLGGSSLGSGILPMLLLVAAGIPLYMCASASTPIAAALLLKGFSPGATLVLLLTGPATNISAIILLARVFGRRFVTLYVSSIVVAAVACGLALDVLVGWLGWSVAGSTGATESGVGGVLQWVFALTLLALAAWRLSKGAGRKGLSELTGSVRDLMSAFGASRVEGEQGRQKCRQLAVIAGVLAIVTYLGFGFVSVPPQSHGYGFLFGALHVVDAEPGLHWLPPPPFGRWQVEPVEEMRKADVGYRTDAEMLAQRRFLTVTKDPQQWHSPVAAMNVMPAEASHLSGDENIVDISFSVHYSIASPEAFLFQVDRAHDLVSLYAQSAARELVASSGLDALLTVQRSQLQEAIEARLQDMLDGVGAGAEVISVHVVDIHPPAESVYAFRDVSSAREDRETLIHKARETAAYLLPRARGESFRIRTDADAEAGAETAIAGGRARGFEAIASAFQADPTLLRYTLWMESIERALKGHRKLIVPPGTSDGAINIWQDMPQTNMPSEGQ